MTARLYLFDDARAQRWEPFALTRPVAELVLGSLRLWERAARAWGVEYGGHLAAGHLVGFREDGGPQALPASAVRSHEPRILVSSRAVLRSAPGRIPRTPAGLRVDDETVGWILPPGLPLPGPRDLADPAASSFAPARIDLDGFVLGNVWDLAARAAGQLREDLVAGMIEPPPPATSVAGAGAAREATDAETVADEGPGALPPGVHLLGGGMFASAPGVTLEPGVVLDTGPGPIVLGQGARVCGPARLEGPLYAGRGSTILGGRVSASFIGPACRIRGEVDHCVLLGYDNKAHGGYLGHAYLGRWVNLGAMTTNSDLRNDYREVRVRTGDGPVSSGLAKLGCFLGDHVKTGIGTLLNTGAVVGAGCNLFAGGAPANHLPPFRWGATPGAPIFRLDRFLDTVARAMSRRGIQLTPQMRGVLERAWRGVARSE